VVALLSGRVLDRTTGQPLAGVTLSVGHRTTTTGIDGRYLLRGLQPGLRTLILQSNDVPAERIRLTLKPGANARDVRACSTTLDYGCGEAPAKSSATLPKISPIVG
jgi:hypothetical protein